MAADSDIAGDDARLEHPFLQPDRMLAIVFGASEWPDYPDFIAAPSFSRSARDIADYLCDRNGLNLPRRNVQVLVDTFESASEIVEQMHAFIQRRRAELKQYGTPATDLLIYYIGHGGFDSRDDFFLAIRRTSAFDPRGTSITAESLGHLIRERADRLRTFMVLDCCFAASMMKIFMSAGPLGVAGKRLDDVLPPQGDAFRPDQIPEHGLGLLCASGPREPAKAPPELPHTMFTGGLLEVLRKGDPTAPHWLSLDNLHRLVTEQLTEKFADSAVIPQVYAPTQRMGRLDLIPLFRNPARQVEPPRAQPAIRPAASQRQDRATEPKDAGAIENALALGGKLEKAGLYAEAALAYRMAADGGDARAQNRLGTLYERGQGVERSEAEAARLYRLAADQGHAGARTNLGFLYLTGVGVQQSHSEAARLYRLAADQGHAGARTSLGWLYEKGHGVQQSHVEAARLYRLAADQGEHHGQYHLGRLCEQGRGVPRSATDAIAWYRRAAREGHGQAAAALRRLEASS
jgi:hypothetical protein